MPALVARGVKPLTTYLPTYHLVAVTFSRFGPFLDKLHGVYVIQSNPDTPMSLVGTISFVHVCMQRNNTRGIRISRTDDIPTVASSSQPHAPGVYCIRLNSQEVVECDRD